MSTDIQSTSDYELINGRRIVKKHVATIHCVNKLSLKERKISNALLYHAYPNLKTSLTHSITLDQLKTLLNVTTRDHKSIKAALRHLMSTVIEWNILGDDIPEMELEGWNASTILSSVSVNNGIVTYQYSELIKTLIIDPKIYGRINLIIQSRFKSAYALALYENCARYRGLKYTKNFDFHDFRRLMGVEEGKYEIFRDFNRRVLAPAVNEINVCSDIRIHPEIRRRGRKVVSIMFHLSERPMKKRIGVTQEKMDAQEDLLKCELKGWGITKKQYTLWIESYGQHYLVNKVNYVKATQEYKSGKIKNLGGYLRSAIEQDYQAPEISDSSVVDVLDEKRRKKDAQAKYEEYTASYIWDQFNELPVGKKQVIIDECIAHYQQAGASGMVVLSVYESRGEVAIRGELVAFIRSAYPELLSEMVAYDEFYSLQKIVQ